MVSGYPTVQGSSRISYSNAGDCHINSHNLGDKHLYEVSTECYEST